MRINIASAFAHYLAGRPLLLAFMMIGVSDVARALVVGAIA